MIEKFSEEELAIIISEIKDLKLNKTNRSRSALFKSEAQRIFGGTPYVSEEIRRHICSVADYMLDNYEYKYPKDSKIIKQKRARLEIPCDIEQEYREIIRRMLYAVKRYYGKIGFRDAGN